MADKVNIPKSNMQEQVVIEPTSSVNKETTAAPVLIEKLPPTIRPLDPTAFPLPKLPSGMTAEEARAKSKFPGGAMGGHSAFLQKRLARGLKYFDSGDYQMAKQNPLKSRMPPLLAQPTGEAIPTPESVPVRKTSIIQHNKISSTAS